MRTIILLLDWDATLFWRDADGGSKIDESALPISDELKRQLNDYYLHYSELHFQNGHPFPVPKIEKRWLDDEGLEIWRRLRAELAGAYRVLFYSEEFSDSFEDPDEFIAARENSCV